MIADVALDREMRCPSCRYRVFTSRAPELVEANRRCPHCEEALRLVPLDYPAFVYPRVTEIRRA